VPQTVTVPAGQLQTSFNVQTAAGAANSTNVVLTATLDQVTLTATLTVQVVTVTIAPAQATLFVNAQLQFTTTVSGTANTRVNWSVQEATGGSITTTGLYTAPGTVGQFHVVATSAAAPTKSATAMVTVRTKTKEKEKEKEKDKEISKDIAKEKEILIESLPRSQGASGPGAVQRPGDDLLVAPVGTAGNEPNGTADSAQSGPAAGRAFIQAEERPAVGQDLLQSHG
jgi:hypothetical protein